MKLTKFLVIAGLAIATTAVFYTFDTFVISIVLSGFLSGYSIDVLNNWKKIFVQVLLNILSYTILAGTLLSTAIFYIDADDNLRSTFFIIPVGAVLIFSALSITTITVVKLFLKKANLPDRPQQQIN